MTEKSSKTYDLSHLQRVLYEAPEGEEHPLCILLRAGDLERYDLAVTDEERTEMRAKYNQLFTKQQNEMPIHNVKGHERAPEELREAIEMIFDAYCDHAKFLDNVEASFSHFVKGDEERGHLSDILEALKTTMADESVPEGMRADAASLHTQWINEQIRRGLNVEDIKRYAPEFVTRNAFVWLTEDPKGPQLDNDAAISAISRAVEPLFSFPLFRTVYPQRNGGTDQFVQSIHKHPEARFAKMIERNRAAIDENEAVLR